MGTKYRSDCVVGLILKLEQGADNSTLSLSSEECDLNKVY